MECWEELIQVGVAPAVRFSEEVESFAEVLRTLIPSDVCLFEPLIDLGNYGILWEIMDYSSAYQRKAFSVPSPCLSALSLARRSLLVLGKYVEVLFQISIKHSLHSHSSSCISSFCICRYE